MGIRAKFNLLMLAIALLGVGLFAFAADPLGGLRRQERAPVSPLRRLGLVAV